MVPTSLQQHRPLVHGPSLAVHRQCEQEAVWYVLAVTSVPFEYSIVHACGRYTVCLVGSELQDVLLYGLAVSGDVEGRTAVCVCGGGWVCVVVCVARVGVYMHPSVCVCVRLYWRVYVGVTTV